MAEQKYFVYVVYTNLYWHIKLNIRQKLLKVVILKQNESILKLKFIWFCNLFLRTKHDQKRHFIKVCFMNSTIVPKALLIFYVVQFSIFWLALDLQHRSKPPLLLRNIFFKISLLPRLSITSICCRSSPCHYVIYTNFERSTLTGQLVFLVVRPDGDIY